MVCYQRGLPRLVFTTIPFPPPRPFINSYKGPGTSIISVATNKWLQEEKKLVISLNYGFNKKNILKCWNLWLESKTKIKCFLYQMFLNVSFHLETVLTHICDFIYMITHMGKTFKAMHRNRCGNFFREKTRSTEHLQNKH